MKLIQKTFYLTIDQVEYLEQIKGSQSEWIRQAVDEKRELDKKKEEA
jgi:hypothetical protein